MSLQPQEIDFEREWAELKKDLDLSHGFNNFKLFPRKPSELPESSELPASGFAKHPCIFNLSENTFLICKKSFDGNIDQMKYTEQYGRVYRICIAVDSKSNDLYNNISQL